MDVPGSEDREENGARPEYRRGKKGKNDLKDFDCFFFPFLPGICIALSYRHFGRLNSQGRDGTAFQAVPH